MKKVKLYEISALVKYAVVIAATSKREAMKHVETWEQCWATTADLIGVSDVELTDVREVTGSIEDEAHEITAGVVLAVAAGMRKEKEAQ